MAESRAEASGSFDVKSDQIEKMIKFLQLHTDYKILSGEEFEKLRRPTPVSHSTPKPETDKIKREGMAPPRPPPPTPLSESRYNAEMAAKSKVSFAGQSILGGTPTYSRPRIPTFSGEEKSEVSFDVWRYEVKCLLREANYPDAVILEAVRGSLKGRARGLLLSLSFTASAKEIIGKLEGVYGNVFSNEALLQKFYMECQQPGQSVADYGLKLESILQLAVDKGQIAEASKNEMLRSKLWSGLRDPLLKNACRYKYDTIKNFDVLRKEIRAIELEFANASHTNTDKIQHQSVMADSDSRKLDELMKSLESLHKRMSGYEQNIGRASGSKTDKTSDGFPPPVPKRYASSRGRRPYRGVRGAGRGSGFSGRGFNNPNRGRFNSNRGNGNHGKQTQEVAKNKGEEPLNQ